MTTPDIFLFVSHIGEDRSAALQVVAELEGRGIPCWIAPRNLSPGKRPDAEIADAIKACRAMLLILSDRSNDSEYIAREITIAGDSGKVLIPFRIAEARPKGGLSIRLTDLHWIDAFISRERAIDEVMDKLRPAEPDRAATGALAFPSDPDSQSIAERLPAVSAKPSDYASGTSPASFTALSPLLADVPSLGRSGPEAKVGLISSLVRRLLLFGGVLATLAVVSSIVLWSRSKPLPSKSVPSKQVAQSVAEAAAPPSADVNSIRAAMNSCEADAKKDAATLRFLIIPLASVQADWRAKSISAVGNAFLLRSDDALGGLKDGTLRIYPGEYDFRVLDMATNMIFKWKPSTGVANFSIADSLWITRLKVQFLTSKNLASDQWGSSFERPMGTCYWVSAIIDD